MDSGVRMLEEEQYSSDSSDDDYVPNGAESDVEELSDEVAESADSSDEDSKEGSKKSKQKKKTNKKSAKLIKSAQNEEQTADDQKASGSCTEVDKERLDSLWANFKEAVPSEQQNKPSKSSEAEIQTTSKVYEFAGEQVKISEVKTVPAPSSQSGTVKRPPPLRSGGLSGLASQLGSGKKPKLSTLEKSKLDWDRFKDDEGIAEDLKSFNQGKQGFLERQAFLERADVKQFEIERSLRAGRKTK